MADTSKYRRHPPSFRSSHAGGVRAFTKLYSRLTPGAKSEICKGLAQTEEELFGELRTAVDRRDIKEADTVVEELKFTRGSEALTCERPR